MTEEKEHQRLEKDISAVEKSCTDLQERWFDWTAAQDAKWETFKDNFLNRLETIRGAVDRKDEVLGALLANVKLLTERIFGVQEELKTTNLSKLNADVEEAHARWRDLEPRMNYIEKTIPTLWTRNQHDKAGEKGKATTYLWIALALTIIFNLVQLGLRIWKGG